MSKGNELHDIPARKPIAEWHSRGYLPHWEAGEAPQSITFRLADSIPASVLAEIRREWLQLPVDKRSRGQARSIEVALDKGHGEMLLAVPAAAEIVQSTLLHFDGERYRLHAWCVMPTHVHALATPLGQTNLSAIVHSWKSWSALAINRALGRSGSVWLTEYFDRKIRSERHFEDVRHYIEQNPVKAGLCSEASGWQYSSAGHDAPPTG